MRRRLSGERWSALAKLGGGHDLVDPDTVAVSRASLDALPREVARTRGEWVGAT